MLDFIDTKTNCTGCEACLNACSSNAVIMIRDEEGFSYPQADANCTNCGKCLKVCPIFSKKPAKHPDVEQHALAAISKDKRIWQSSASGGAFTEICKVFGGADTVICGAAFDGLKVQHTHVVGWQRNVILRRSKYVQSDIGTCYRKARDFLEKDQHVIFSGTPCQVAGLKSYLGRDYDRLLCIDFICHGVGSPGVFATFLDFLDSKYDARIVSYTFRFKKVFLGNFMLYVSRYMFDDGKSVTVEKDEYNRLFLQQLCLRPSCSENCHFRTKNRLSDLTISDFKRRDKAFPKSTDYRNYSTIIVNSQKGCHVLGNLNSNMDISPCPLNHVQRYNPLFDGTTPGNPKRNAFFKDYAGGTEFRELAEKYEAVPSKGNAANIVKRLIPYRLKSVVRKVCRT